MILMADNTGNRLLRGKATTIRPLVRKSHRLKRMVRSTLAAEAMAASEAAKAGDVMMAHIAEAMQGIEATASRHRASPR